MSRRLGARGLDPFLSAQVALESLGLCDLYGFFGRVQAFSARRQRTAPRAPRAPRARIQGASCAFPGGFGWSACVRLESTEPSDESDHVQSQCVSTWRGSVFALAGVPARMVRSVPIYEGRGKMVTLLSSRRKGGSEDCGACSESGSCGSSRAASMLEQQMMEPIL